MDISVILNLFQNQDDNVRHSELVSESHYFSIPLFLDPETVMLNLFQHQDDRKQVNDDNTRHAEFISASFRS